MDIIEYRVENKYIVSDLDLAVLKRRLQHVTRKDPHQIEDHYAIRSVYFDDIQDRCLKENESGVDQRKKYRIRMYEGDHSPIHLEIKEKRNNLTKKDICTLTSAECSALLQGCSSLPMDDRKPLNQLLLQMRIHGMRPKISILYERTAFVHPVGNVRITFDRNISVCTQWKTFLEGNMPEKIPVLPQGMHVLEVKYDELLPDMIARQLEIGTLRQTAFSKYYLGRSAAAGEFLID